MAGNTPLPIFPLHAVLFPGGALPLHIFEPRYRLMIARCLAADATFGVVLIKEGLEVGDPAVPHVVGTLARIVHHERHADGRMDLVCVGGDRFRLSELRHDEPYLTALTEPLLDAPEPPPTALAERLRAAVDRFAADSHERPSLRLPGDPAALSFALAGGLPLPLDQAQALLEETSAAARLRSLLEMVEREHRLRGRVGSTRPASPSHVRRPSPN